MKRLNIITKCNPFGLFQLKHYFHDSVEKLEKHSESKCSDPVYSILLESKMKKEFLIQLNFTLKCSHSPAFRVIQAFSIV